MATARFEEIVEDFDFIDEWEDRYRYVIDLGKKMPPLSEGQKIPATKVEGCASQVWIVPEIEGEGATAHIGFQGESDAMIVWGLIAVLHALYDGLTPEEALKVDAQAEMGRLGLDQHLSSQRSNGLRAMIQRIRQISNALL
ncbi:MAG: cysteine desulfuration protein SufE [Rhodobacteraceae bacterium]|nr:MAG: cysteine desulfuration protein SufE [Paracoccaceae bacterium]